MQHSVLARAARGGQSKTLLQNDSCIRINPFVVVIVFVLVVKIRTMTLWSGLILRVRRENQEFSK